MTSMDDQAVPTEKEHCDGSWTWARIKKGFLPIACKSFDKTVSIVRGCGVMRVGKELATMHRRCRKPEAG